MANSIAKLSKGLHRLLLSNPRFCRISVPFSTDNTLSSAEEEYDSNASALNSDVESLADSGTSESPSLGSGERRAVFDAPLENGLDVGIYKAIIVGQVGQKPVQKVLRSGRKVTLLSVGTGGIKNNRRPLENEDPRDYANRSAVQWHRVSIYPDRLGEIVAKSVLPGSILYLEGNLETKIFSDPVTGLVRRIREIAIRRNGRVVFVGKAGEAQQSASSELKSVGYF